MKYTKKSQEICIFTLLPIYTPRYKRMRPRASLCPIAVLLVLLLRHIQSILQKSNYPIHFLARTHKNTYTHMLKADE